MHFDTTTLANGLKVHYQERNVPWVHVLFLIHVGTRYDPIGKEGCAHVLEHHLLAGTHGQPQRNLMELIAWLAAQGITASLGWTDLNSMWFDGTTIKEHTPTLLRFFRDHILHPTLDGDYEKDREIVRNERAQRTTSRSRAIDAALKSAFCGAHRLENATGLPEDDVLDALTQTDARAMHATYFHPGNIEVIGLGGLETKTFFQKVQDEFASENNPMAIREQHAPFLGSKPAIPQRFFKRETERAASKIEIRAVWTIPVEAARHAHLAVLTLKEFYNEFIREALKASYGFEAGSDASYDHSFVLIGTGVAPDKKELILQAMQQTLSDVASLKRVQHEFKRKRLLELQLLDMTGKQTVTAARESIVTNGTIRTLETQLTALQEWTFEDLMETLNTWLTPERRYLQIVEH